MKGGLERGKGLGEDSHVSPLQGVKVGELGC